MKLTVIFLAVTACAAAQQKPSPMHHRAKPEPKPDITTSISGPPLELHREIPLPANAQTALALSESAQAAGAGPVLDSTGRVVYTFGQGTPTIVCSVLQMCEVDLEPGETISKDSTNGIAIDLADNRFSVTPRVAGAGPESYPYLAIKPKETGSLDTSLVVGTDRRSYYIRLISRDDGRHMRRVAFAYPQDEAKKRAAAELAAEQQKAAAAKLATLNAQRSLRNWTYSVKLHGRDAEYLRPYSIADDGIHTRIMMSEQARHRGLPVVQIEDARGPIPANARWDGNELMVDAVFEHACLLEGVGRKQQRACITNEGLGN